MKKFATVCMGISAWVAVVLSFLLGAREDPFAGTWDLNLSKSHYELTPAPKESRTTYSFSVFGGSMRVVDHTIDAAGKDAGFTRTEYFNGPSIDQAGKQIWVRRVGDRTIEILSYGKYEGWPSVRGPIISSLTRTILENGKTLTAVAINFAETPAKQDVGVFDKRE